MARKKKEEEISIIAGKNDSDTVTELEVLVKTKIGESSWRERRHYTVIDEMAAKDSSVHRRCCTFNYC